MKTKNLVRIAILGAIGYVLMLLEFPLLPTAGFLKLNFCDIPSLLAAFSMGPLAGLMVVAIENALHLFQTFSGGIGELANFLVSGTFVVVAGVFYRNNHTKKGARVALILGGALMVIMALFANRFLLLPLYMPAGTPEQFTSLLLSAILPFNLIKGLIIIALTLVLYKPLSPLLKNKTERS